LRRSERYGVREDEFAPERLLPDILTAAGFKQTRPLFAAIKLAESTVTVRHTPKLEAVVDACVLSCHRGNTSFFGKNKKPGMPPSP
jgi:hypothetical protein